MEYTETKVLETERLLLRPFVMEDRDAMYRNWASDPEVTRFLTWPTHASPEVTEEVLKSWVEKYAQKDYCSWCNWAIVPKTFGEPIGSITVVACNDKAETVTVGYCIGRQWWRQGITSEALGLVIDYLIGEVGINRVESYHDANNPNSGAVMRKCGMVYEGTHRQSDWNNQGICDKCYYAILAEEWRAKRQKTAVHHS